MIINSRINYIFFFFNQQFIEFSNNILFKSSFEAQSFEHRIKKKKPYLRLNYTRVSFLTKIFNNIFTYSLKKKFLKIHNILYIPWRDEIQNHFKFYPNLQSFALYYAANGDIPLETVRRLPNPDRGFPFLRFLRLITGVNRGVYSGRVSRSGIPRVFRNRGMPRRLEEFPATRDPRPGAIIQWTKRSRQVITRPRNVLADIPSFFRPGS